ncbi:MAG TPA: hypothetical protein VF911_08240 [Thermoanaerobaculia bacterium]|jgi:hypothetical protein
MSAPLFFALYCVEAGLFFTVVPWTTIWTLNPVLHSSIAVGSFVDNSFLRGFVSGLGLLHLLLGIRDLMRIFRARRGSAPR